MVSLNSTMVRLKLPEDFQVTELYKGLNSTMVRLKLNALEIIFPKEDIVSIPLWFD